LTEAEFRQARNEYGERFEAGMGAEACQRLVAALDLEALTRQLRDQLASRSPPPAAQCRRALLRRLRVIEALRLGERVRRLFLENVPVLPPELRPVEPVPGSRHAGDLNALYAAVFERNWRLGRLEELNAPEVIIRNEK